MKRLITGAIALFVACRNQDQPQQSESRLITKSDSANLAVYEDSVLDAMRGVPSVVTRNGDTLVSFGGLMMEGQGARDYGIDEYAKNGVHYLRITRTIGHKPNGHPIFSTRARLRLPPSDSTEELVTEGLCLVNGKEDRFVIGIAGIVGDSVQWQARHAWRFDLPSETLHEIPTAGITCGHLTIDD